MCIIRRLLILVLIFTIFAGLFTSSVLAAMSTEVTVVADPAWETAFTLTHVHDQLITIDWTIPAPYDQVIIRAKYGEYPVEPVLGEMPTDGYLVYSGNGTSANDTSMNLDYSGDQLYYRAWAGNTTYWAGYFGQDYVEGIGMTLIAEQLEGLNNFLISFDLFSTIWSIVLPLLIVVGLTLLAYWHRDRMLYGLAGVVCIVFGFLQLTNIYFSIPVVLLGIYNIIKIKEPARQ